MTRAYYSFIAIFITVSLQLLCIIFIHGGEDNNPYYQIALGAVSVITMVLLFVIWATRPDTVKSLLKSDYGLDLHGLMLASFVSTSIYLTKYKNKVILIEKIKEEIIYLSKKFDSIRNNFSEECRVSLQLTENVNKESVIKKGIAIHLENPWGRFVSHYIPGTCEHDGMIALTFYTFDSSSGLYYDLSNIEVSKKYLDALVEKKELIELHMPVYISYGETLAVNPDGKIFIVKNN